MRRVTVTHRKGAERLGEPGPSMECGTCGRSGLTSRHPCRFEVACSCWRGLPCDGSGRIGRRAGKAF